MTEAKRETPDYWTAYHDCRVAAENLLVASAMPPGEVGVSYIATYEKWARDYFAKAADALGYRLVALEPAPVTNEPGFDGRDGGRMHEISTAQEA